MNNEIFEKNHGTPKAKKERINKIE